MKPAFKPKYRKPTGVFIPRNEDTERLYELESKRNDAFEKAARELKEVLGFEHFWQEAVPEAMLNILEGWDHNAAQLGAITYLEKQNDRAYTEPWQCHVVMQCDLTQVDEAIEALDRMMEHANIWENVPENYRHAIVYLTNAIKVARGRE